MYLVYSMHPEELMASGPLTIYDAGYSAVLVHNTDYVRARLASITYILLILSLTKCSALVRHRYQVYTHRPYLAGLVMDLRW